MIPKKNIDEFGFEPNTHYSPITIIRNLLGTFENQKILDVGCGTALRGQRRVNMLNVNDSDCHQPVLSLACARENAIVSGLDMGFIKKPEEYLKKFESDYNIKPIPSHAQNIDEHFKEDQFDLIVSSFFLGLPTTELNMEDIFQKLYQITKPLGYQYHYSFEPWDFKLKKSELEDIGFEVLHSFYEKTLDKYGNTLILRRE
ncbi:class I SAM-dependent methyltransferase [Candidatus Woesearchaeota archaeon]|nr:class I SAM-dependent methyltransferase [Candidatus Woesearchaeota archaeon]